MANGLSLYVKHAYGNVFDVFWGNGWTSWTRVLWKKQDVTYIKGKVIDQDEKNTIRAVLLDEADRSVTAAQ